MLNKDGHQHNTSPATSDSANSTIVRKVGLTVDKEQLVRLMGIHNYASRLPNVVKKKNFCKMLLMQSKALINNVSLLKGTGSLIF